MEAEANQKLETIESDGSHDHTPNLQLRSYQLEMLEHSMRQNIVVAMDTGSGKTFIAVSRINAELERCPGDKLAWFLAPHVALADQQHNVLAKHLPGFQTRLLTGADGVEHWKQRIWDEVLYNIRIVVSTHQVLLDALIHGFVPMTRLAILVFDEAHHCIKNDPANRIMKDFYTHSLKQNPLQVPAILGLTASPVVNRRHGGLEKIEANLHAITRTPKLHRDELLRHVHQPKLVRLLYPSKPAKVKISLALENLRQLYANPDLELDPYVIKLRADSNRNDSSVCKVLLNRKTYCQDQIKGFLRKAEDIYTELGSWAAEYFIKSCIEKFQAGISDDFANFNFLDNAEKTYLMKLFETVIVSDEQGLQDDSNISPKAKTLISFLEAEANANFSGLVFVQTRASVVVLAHLLSKHIRTKDIFTISTFVGASKTFGKQLAIGDLVDVRNQKDTLEDLRFGRKNLIITTSALEEGIDVAICNQVVCFEQPRNLKSFIQRRGRARKSESTYAIMIEESGDLDAMSTWQDLEAEMIQVYMDEMRHLQEIQDLEGSETGTRELFIESTGAKLTLDDAVRHLQHFCATLPQTQFVDSRPIFTFSVTTVSGRENGITATVTLPSSVAASVRKAHGSSRWRTERLAKMDAAFEAYKALYHIGLVNDNLLPLRFDLEKDEARSAVEKRPSLVEVPAQLDIWSEFVSKEWQGQPTLYESLVSVQNAGITISQNLMILPLALPNSINFDIFWDATESFNVVVRPLQSVPYCEERLDLYRNCTALLLRSIYRVRMNENTDFACIFIPPHVESLSAWLDAASGSNPAMKILDMNMNQPQVGLVHDLTNNRMPHVFHSIEPLPSDFQDRPSNRANKTVSKYINDPFYLKVSKLPKRADFLHGVPLGNLKSAKQAGVTYLSASHCEVDKLPFEFSRFAMLIPSIMHQVELHIAAEHCRRSLLYSVEINDLNLIITATSASVAREQTNYQRLEFLGDSILKFMTSLTIMAEHLNWHEGFLSGKKDHTVSNARLASSAMNVSLAQYIRTIPFTGHKWRPLYNSNVMTHELKTTREMSTKTLADVVEALIGACYVDGGLAKVLKCLAIFLPEIPWAPLWQQVPKLYNSYDISLQYPCHFQELEALIDYTFTVKTLLVEALTHPSHHGPNTGPSYQRLEFLGDSILDNIVVSAAYSHEPPIPTLSLHLLRTALVNASFLAFLCLTHSIPMNRYNVILNPGGDFSTIESSNSVQIWRFMRKTVPDFLQTLQSCLARYDSLRDQISAALRHGKHYPWVLFARLEAPKFFSDLIESLLGAIYVDTQGSFEACESFLDHIGLMGYLKRVRNGEVALLHPKEEVGQLANMEKVKYVVTREKGEQGKEEHGRKLNCALWVGEREIVKVGDGVSVIEVETRAAEEAVKFLKVEMNGATSETALPVIMETEMEDVAVEDVDMEDTNPIDTDTNEMDADELGPGEPPLETTPAEKIERHEAELSAYDELTTDDSSTEDSGTKKCISM